MSVRAKYHLLVFVGWFAGGLALAVIGMMVHPVIIVVLFPYGAVMAFLLLRLRCPNCRRRLATQTYLMGPYMGRRCRYCGFDLSRKD